MTVHLPRIGVTLCRRAIIFLDEYPQNVVGSFWIMSGYGFREEALPYWWIDTVLEENQAQSLLDALEREEFRDGHENPLYLGFCILVIADHHNPFNLSYVIQHLRMEWFEAGRILEAMAQNNIPAHTEVTYPKDFLHYRYGEENPNYRYLSESMSYWSVQLWEDYCSYLMAEHGQQMLGGYIEKTSAIKKQVFATVEKGGNPMVLTEGETDPIYIKKAFQLFNKQEILHEIDIEWVGASIGKGKSINTGDSGLNSTRDVLLSNPNFVTREILLLYDCDTRKADQDFDNLKIRRIPEHKNRKIKKGIENLFPDHLFTSDFYIERIKYGNYGEENRIQEFQKMKFCEWVCTRGEKKDFADFELVINIIEQCFEISN